jgi:hypothetical protein
LPEDALREKPVALKAFNPLHWKSLKKIGERSALRGAACSRQQWGSTGKAYLSSCAICISTGPASGFAKPVEIGAKSSHLR